MPSLFRVSRPFVIVPFAAALTISAAACGSSTGSVPNPSVTPGGAIPAGAVVIDQRDLAFKPGSATIEAGQKVYFQNSETALHTVSINGKDESGNMKRGAIFVWTFASPGSYKITCEYHPQMHATITVKPAPAAPGQTTTSTTLPTTTGP